MDSYDPPISKSLTVRPCSGYVSARQRCCQLARASQRHRERGARKGRVGHDLRWAAGGPSAAARREGRVANTRPAMCTLAQRLHPKMKIVIPRKALWRKDAQQRATTLTTWTKSDVYLPAGHPGSRYMQSLVVRTPCVVPGPSPMSEAFHPLVVRHFHTTLDAQMHVTSRNPDAEVK